MARSQMARSPGQPADDHDPGSRPRWRWPGPNAGRATLLLVALSGLVLTPLAIRQLISQKPWPWRSLPRLRGPVPSQAQPSASRQRRPSAPAAPATTTPAAAAMPRAALLPPSTLTSAISLPRPRPEARPVPQPLASRSWTRPLAGVVAQPGPLPPATALLTPSRPAAAPPELPPLPAESAIHTGITPCHDPGSEGATGDPFPVVEQSPLQEWGPPDPLPPSASASDPAATEPLPCHPNPPAGRN
jgi:hypothetical protein